MSDAAIDHPGPIDAGPPCTTCQLHVQYRSADVSAIEIKPILNVVNVGTTTVQMSELTIRYWYSIDGDKPQVYFCDYAKVGNGNVTGKFVKLPAAQGGADYYLELGFKSAAGPLAGGTESGEIQNRFNKSDYSPYNKADDYSYDPAKTTFTDWMRVTLYDNGGLVWGTEPGCDQPTDGAVCAPDGGNPDAAVDASGSSDASDM